MIKSWQSDWDNLNPEEIRTVMYTTNLLKDFQDKRGFHK
jgi:transposase-like protein